MKLGGDYLTEKELKKYRFKKLGRNVKIHERASLYGTENISIGDNVRIDDYVVMVATGKIEIGSYVHISNFCFFGGAHGIVIGDFVGIAPHVMIFSSSDDYSGEKLVNPALVPKEMTGGKKGKVVLGKHVIIGAGSVILPNCTIGEGVAIGALSLVLSSLKPWGVYFGSPVRRLYERKKDLLKLEKKLLKK